MAPRIDPQTMAQLIYEVLMTREGMLITPEVAKERANNLAQVLLSALYLGRQDALSDLSAHSGPRDSLCADCGEPDSASHYASRHDY